MYAFKIVRNTIPILDQDQCLVKSRRDHAPLATIPDRFSFPIYPTAHGDLGTRFSPKMLVLSGVFCIIVIGCQGAVNSGFKSYPTTVKTFENDTVLLPCYVEDLDNVQTRVRWWRDGILLADSGEPRHTQPERIRMYANRSLEVSHVQRNDTGEYVCQASRPAPWGHATQVHEIEVMYPPSVQPVPESGQLEVNLGEEVDMACVSKGVPIPIISWRTKDGEIPFLYDRSRLRFHAESPSDAGRYTCIANNDVGQPATAYIDLFVRYKPRIEMTKTWMHAPPGIRVQLHCGVTAWPEAKVEWYFNNRTVKYSSRIVKHNAGSDHSLVIRNVRVTDYGFYLCRAFNSLGITEAAIELSGIANPAVFKKTSRSLSKTSYNFVWEVYSYSPIVQYEFRFRKHAKGAEGQWHKLYIPSGSDGNSLIHTSSFNLTGLAEASHYEALVLSRNRYGWSKPSEILRFATEGAPAEDESYITNSVEEDKIVPVVQLASMSQHSALGTDSGSSTNEEKIILVILPVLYVTHTRYYNYGILV